MNLQKDIEEERQKLYQLMLEEASVEEIQKQSESLDQCIATYLLKKGA